LLSVAYRKIGLRTGLFFGRTGVAIPDPSSIVEIEHSLLFSGENSELYGGSGLLWNIHV